MLAVCPAHASESVHSAEDIRSAADDGRLLPPLSFTIKPDVRSAYVSRGKIVEDRPVQTILARVAADAGPFGSLGIHTWSLSSLSDRRLYVHQHAFNEVDMSVFWHYDYAFNDSWKLSSEVYKYWITLNGYTDPYRARKSDASISEWRFLQSLENPYLTPFYLLRRGVAADDWLYTRVGARHTFPLGGGFALTPQYYAEISNERLFSRRYGPRVSGNRYRSGMHGSNLILELSWKMNGNVTLFTNVHQFDIVSSEARHATKASSNPCLHRDLTVATVGMRLKF